MSRRPRQDYSQVSPLRRALITLVALSPEGLTPSTLARIAGTIDLMAAGVVHGPVDEAFLLVTIQDLIHQGWLIRDTDGTLFEWDAITSRIMGWARSAGIWPALASALEDSSSGPISVPVSHQLRLVCARKDWKEYLAIEGRARQEGTSETILDEWLHAFLEPVKLDPSDLDAMPPSLWHRVAHLFTVLDLANLRPHPGILDHLIRKAVSSRAGGRPQSVHLHEFEAFLIAGRLREALDWTENLKIPDNWRPFRGRIKLFLGDSRGAVEEFQHFLPRSPKQEELARFGIVPSVYFPLALMSTGDVQDLEASVTLCEQLQRHGPRSVDYRCLHLMARVIKGDAPRPGELSRVQDSELGWDATSLHVYYLTLVRVLDEPSRMRPRDRSELLGLARQADTAGHLHLSAELHEIIARSFPDDRDATRSATHAAGLRRAHDFPSTFDIVPWIPVWKRRLDRLVALEKPSAPRAPADSGAPVERLVWKVMLERGRVQLIPSVQKRSKKGAWTKGREVSIPRLANDPRLEPLLADVDRIVMDELVTHQYGHYIHAPLEHARSMVKSLEALRAHPLVFHEENPDHFLEIVRAEPRVHVERGVNDLRLRMEPTVLDPEYPLHLDFSTAGQMKFYLLDRKQLQVAEILREGLTVPVEAESRVLEAIRAIAPRIALHSDIGEDIEGLEDVAPDPRLRIRLSPAGEGLQVSIRVQPFGDSGPVQVPGQGGRVLVSTLGGRRARTLRDLAAEQARLESLLQHAVTGIDSSDDPTDLLLVDVEPALEFLDALRTFPEPHLVEWPEGRSIQLKPALDVRKLSLRVQHDHDFFSIDGTLEVDEGKVMEIKKLVKLMEVAKGRFLPMGDDRFLSLTRELQRRLEDLKALSTPGSEGIRIHPLMAPLAESIVSDVGHLEVDAGWTDHIERIRQAEALDAVLPRVLEAELRPYQIEGFQWMSRLLEWEAGACLADDMGLGKTVQTIALLLRRAAAGPALVVGPTSVIGNWLEEIRRFAPTLNPVLLAGTSEAQTLGPPRAHDVVLVSYTVLAASIDRMSEHAWSTVVLDEAQAIKNPETQRARAVIRLRAPGRIALTGTPLENHLGELWSLFRFLDPGLLGSQESFRARYVLPIEGRDDRGARLRLKKLISPFILRRTKAQVLEDLPPRTEVLRKVDLGPEERAFYEAVRQEALEKLASGKNADQDQRFRILAEITRLRRASCNPRLVLPETSIPSAKLEEFEAIVDELVEGGHRCLVFSQFVGHLALLEERLGAKGILYEYLDGSTPAKKRRETIEAFQTGSAPLFLISLKAGGLGLNLTAADYVIHMDPWWNPAVEDQASDRAHRIGQRRPVTIYRIIARDTIEEKILALHHRKRDLAFQILEGEDIGHKLSVDELMDLLREDRTG